MKTLNTRWRLIVLVPLVAIAILSIENRTGAVPAEDLSAGKTAKPPIFVTLSTPNLVGKPGTTLHSQDTILARINYALASYKSKASASSFSPGYDPNGAIDGDRKGLNFGKDGYWSSKDGTLPQSLEVVFNGQKTITEISVFTIQDNYASPLEPTPTMEFTLYGLTDFDVQYFSEWTGVPYPGGVPGGLWVTIPGGSRRGNKLVWNRFDFSKTPITTSRIRVRCLGSIDKFGRIAELEAWSK